MRYLVRAKVKPHCGRALLAAIERRVLGRGSVAQGEYLRNMAAARVDADGTVKWVEVCFCATPLDEERPYWERYFELTRVQDAHGKPCRDRDGSEPWACETCDCTERFEHKLAAKGEAFLDRLRRENASR
ncbi:MAG TPA: hypothetical protein VKE42_12625 [Candidatus Cybelea sp.]|nr:hypothetical protein [Candidatus Cybelea sp.]